MAPPDLRPFLFTATGDATDLARLTSLDVYDNLTLELDKLAAVIELLEVAHPAEADARVLPKIGLVLKDIRARMRAILDLAQEQRARARPRLSRVRSK